MNYKPNQSIKRAQRESLLYKEVSNCMLMICLDDPCLRDLMVNRVQLSPDKSVCTIFFYSAQGQEAYHKLEPRLNEYKATVRNALAKALQSRYTPNLVFSYDFQLEKQMHIERLLDKVKLEEEQ